MILNPKHLPEYLADALFKAEFRPLVFTNGVFDILHRGHVAYLQRARNMGASLMVALNTDDSVRRLGKAMDRPINTIEARMAVINALVCVDIVTWFSDSTPLRLIKRVKPNVLVKGGDYDPRTIVGADYVLSTGGTIQSIPIEHKTSTTALIERIRSSNPR